MLVLGELVVAFPLSCKSYGLSWDGGALITNNYELAQFARSIRDHGRGPGLEAINWGRNSRLDSLNARVIIERLKQLNNLIDKRRKLADIYFSHLKRLENNGIFETSLQNTYKIART